MDKETPSGNIQEYEKYVIADDNEETLIIAT